MNRRERGYWQGDIMIQSLQECRWCQETCRFQKLAPTCRASFDNRSPREWWTSTAIIPNLVWVWFALAADIECIIYEQTILALYGIHMATIWYQVIYTIVIPDSLPICIPYGIYMVSIYNSLIYHICMPCRSQMDDQSACHMEFIWCLKCNRLIYTICMPYWSEIVYQYAFHMSCICTRHLGSVGIHMWPISNQGHTCHTAPI